MRFKDRAKWTLELPLSWTFRDERFLDRGIPEAELMGFKEAYSREEFTLLVRALRWAATRPQEDFASLLPNLEYDNERLYAYLALLYGQFLKKHLEWYGGVPEETEPG
jgi:hypothetical protein